MRNELGSGDYRFIKFAAGLRPALCSVVLGFRPERDHSLGQRDSNFGFTGHYEIGAGTAQSICLEQMRAKGKHAQIRIYLQGMLDDRGVPSRFKPEYQRM